MMRMMEVTEESITAMKLLQSYLLRIRLVILPLRARALGTKRISLRGRVVILDQELVMRKEL